MHLSYAQPTAQFPQYRASVVVPAGYIAIMHNYMYRMYYLRLQMHYVAAKYFHELFLEVRLHSYEQFLGHTLVLIALVQLTFIPDMAYATKSFTLDLYKSYGNPLLILWYCSSIQHIWESIMVT